MSMFTRIGLIFLVLVLIIIVAEMVANQRFIKKAEQEAEELLATAPTKGTIVHKENLKGLPTCVQRWLEYAQVIGKERITTVRLKQKGMMRTSETGKWMEAEAEQYFTVDEPGFVWIAKVKMAPFVKLAGRDKYEAGKGQMLIKLLSLISVVNAHGKEIDQGTLLRYLAEMPWFPTAALSSYVSWEEIDTYHARATMSYGGVTASGVFEFDSKGQLVSFTANRYRDVNGKYESQKWGGFTRGYKEFRGIRIPNKLDVVWMPETGDFHWFKCEITDIEYNKPFLY